MTLIMWYIIIATLTLLFRASNVELNYDKMDKKILVNIYLTSIFWPVYFLCCLKGLYESN